MDKTLSDKLEYGTEPFYDLFLASYLKVPRAKALHFLA